MSDAAAFGYIESIRAGEFDQYLDSISMALYERFATTGLADRDRKPKRPLPPGVHWVWLNGPVRPHWGAVWTGAKV